MGAASFYDRHYFSFCGRSLHWEALSFLVSFFLLELEFGHSKGVLERLLCIGLSLQLDWTCLDLKSAVVGSFCSVWTY